MRILITADFQADYQNLDLCQQAWDEILGICREQGIEYVVVAGDLKQVYNPVDVRVTKWWFKAIRQANDNGANVLCNLGNHDRLGLYVATDNWFPVLRKAGAVCYDKPRTVKVGDLVLAFLPYRSNLKVLREDADKLASEIRQKEKSILIFHGDIAGAKYNQLGSRFDNGIEADWLYADRYAYCIGGHVHLQQKIGNNVFYVGSPFAQDWGECNQRKGYVITDGRRIEFFPSRLPGWFDPTWPNFYEPDSWQGTKVRLHVKCRSSLEFISEVDRVRCEGEQRYRGAEIFVNATVAEAGEKEEVQISISDPDEVKVREYVKQTCPENVSPDKVIKYLVSKIGQQSGRWERSGTGVRFLKAKAQNFLSFKELEINWNQRGIVVVQGQNQDRSGKSNGSGKTSLLQTIPVSLFGSTFKGQKHDRWAKRGCEDTAKVSLLLRDSKNRTIKITRTRKPAKLRLWVDGEEQSTGMKPQDKEGTQSLIEKLTGFTWQTLSNAVYIDQEVAYQFVAGTKKSRTDVLSKIQNLERFQKALDGVKKDRSKAEIWARQVEESIAVLDERIDGCNKKLSMLVEESEQRIKEAEAELEERRKAKDNGGREKLIILKSKMDEAEAHYDRCGRKLQKAEWQLNSLREAKRLMTEKVATCPTCKQNIDHKHASVLEVQIRDAQDGYSSSLRIWHVTEAKYEAISVEYNKLYDQFRELDLAYTECERQVRELKRREHNESFVRQDVKNELDAAIQQKKSLEKHQQEHISELSFYVYCEKALSRDGIPSFLNALLCKPLNTAAEFYSETFAENSLKVRFELENGEFVPIVLNATGGEGIEDQSDGERALAGLIASFALRETTPSCNLLILDEPGHGLDPSAARQFAKGLRGLLNKFDSIWLTTHNPVIASELVDQHVVSVVKSKGVSSIQ